jgi:hypothetical protein
MIGQRSPQLHWKDSNAGNISINAHDSMLIDNGSVLSGVLRSMATVVGQLHTPSRLIKVEELCKHRL